MEATASTPNVIGFGWRPAASSPRAEPAGRAISARRTTRTAVERIMAVRPRTGPGLYRSLNKIPSDEQDRFRLSHQALVRDHGRIASSPFRISYELTRS